MSRRPALLLSAATIATIVIASCSAAHSSPVIGASSGARLRAWVEDGGGPRRFLHWHDTELDVDCAFRATPSDDYRCLELGAARVVFADAACTDAIAEVYAYGDATSEYAITYDTTVSCGLGGLAGIGVTPASLSGELAGLPRMTATEVRAVGAPRATPSMLFASVDGVCSPTFVGGFGLLPSYAELGEVVPFSRFARATRTETAHAGGITSVALTADDGATETIDVVNHESGATCTLIELDGRWRCAPRLASATHETFADATCTSLAAVSYGASACAPPLHIVLGQRCMEGTLHALGPATTRFSNGSGTCAPAPSSSDEGAWTIGDAIDGEALAAIAPEVASVTLGDGALRAATHAATDGTPLRFREWRTSDGRACSALVVGDEVFCARVGYAGSTFADAACTEPLVADLSCDGIDLAYEPATHAMHVVGDVFTGASYARAGSSCLSTSSPTGVLHRLGDPVDPSTLPRLTRMLD